VDRTGLQSLHIPYRLIGSCRPSLHHLWSPGEAAQPDVWGGSRPAEPRMGGYDVTTAPAALPGGAAAVFPAVGAARRGTV
jgi:hypothetical protein